MDSAAIECLHGTLGSAGVIVLDETIVVALGLGPNVSAKDFGLGKEGLSC